MSPKHEYPVLTREERNDLARYAAKMGPRKWKQSLQAAWERGMPLTPEFPTLYALRNSHGNEWLRSVKASDFSQPAKFPDLPPAPPKAELTWKDGPNETLVAEGKTSDGKTAVMAIVDREHEGRFFRVSKLASSDGSLKNEWGEPLMTKGLEAMKETVALQVSQKAYEEKIQRFPSTTPGVPERSPWGKVQNAEVLKLDDLTGEAAITYVSTAGHGGFMLSRNAASQVPPVLRNSPRGTTYEQDADWCRVALSFPECFTPHDLSKAEATLRNYDPDTWQAYYGRELQPGQSRTLDERNFLAAHKDDYIVTSAVRSDDYPGMVAVFAAPGGDRNLGQSRFLVPGDEYSDRPSFGFVIDTDRHMTPEEYEASMTQPENTSDFEP